MKATESQPLQGKGPGDSRPFVIPVFLPHAGCQQRCIFCNQHNLIHRPADRSFTPRHLRRHVVDMLQYRSPRRKKVQIAFYGGNFLGLPPRGVSQWLDAARRCIDDRLADSIRFSTRPDTIDDKRLRLVSGYPVSTIELGAQSMDDGVLSLARRGHSAAHTVEAVKMLGSHEFRIGIQLMVGLPGESERINQRTGKQVCALRPDFVRIYPTLVLKNSQLAVWHADGRYHPLSLNESVQRVKTLLKLFWTQQIAVTRMGLQASEALDSGDVLKAGPYHPAFGHLVYSELFFDAVVAWLKSVTRVPTVIRFHVHPRSVSKLKGNQRINMDRLKKRFRVQQLKVTTSREIPVDAVSLNGGPLIRVFETPDQMI